ncbi:little elongation complex subunit 1 isoform X2 [Candoia aspera]|uniref:little elongation complex subunit 1 isoform X2 n=1 Tax=Candoia aspera TaxID=51853 RepID=UPI002FD7DBE2
MMPGETPPAANTTAIAAEAATACANCGALQQNLNEYVAALIALKQKIIDADHLLAEYQQKCTQLQFAKRENSTLHHQVEQMFQKISPLKKCQEELGTVKAELEEKKSSLKIYQETHLEYVRVKEEMDKSDSVKKKLETKVKKLEEAAAKHTQEFKQLKAEKKVLEKELKKAQEKIDGFPNRKQKKVLKNAETQSESENLVANLDKEKIKLLLEELWQCIESSTGKKQINKCEHVLETVQNPEKVKKSEGAWISNCSLEPSTMLTSPTSLKIKLDKKSAGNSRLIENTFMETTEANNSSSAFDEDRCLEAFTEADFSTSNMDLLNKEQEEFGESLQDVLKWLRPLPPLLSPIQFSPAATPDTLFGDITDSSDDEMEENAQTLENIIEECDEDKPASKALHLTEFCSHILNNSSIKTDPQEPHERSKKLENKESVLLPNFMYTTSKYLNESNAKPKDEEKQLKENSDFVQIHTAPEVVSPSTENLSEKMINVTETKDQIFSEHVLEETNDFIQKEEKKKLIETEEDVWGQSPKGGEQQQTKEPILTAENTPVASQNVKDPSNDKEGGVLESISEDHQTESYSGKARLLCEKHTEHITVNEQNMATEGNSEPLIEEKKNVSNCKFLPETNHLCEEVQQPGGRITFTESIEKSVNSLEASHEPHSIEEICSKQNGNEINGKNELVDVLKSNSDIATLTGGLKQSSYHGGEIIEAMSDKPTKNVADGTTEGTKLEDTQKEEFLQLKQLLDEKKSIKSPQEESTCNGNTNKLPTPASIAEDSLLKSEGLIEASHESLELENVTENAPQLGQVENADIKPKNMSKVEGIGNSLNSYMEDLQPLRKTLMEINCESKKLAEMGTIQSLTAGLSENTCIKTLYVNIDSPGLIHGPLQIEKNSTMIINELSDTKKYAMEEKGMNYDCSASDEVASVENRGKGTVQPIQNISQGENEEIESGLSVIVTGDSEANMESVDVTASNFEVKVDFFSRNSQNIEAANPPSSIPKCIASSSPNKENSDCVDQHNSEESWKNEKSKTVASEGKTVASEGDKLLNLREINWDYHSPCNKKDEMDIEQDKNDFSKPQASVTTKSCSRENSEMLSSEASSPNSINSIDICVENKLLLSHEELIPGDKNLDMLSGNDTVEYIDEKTAKEANTILSTEIRSRGIDEINMLENSVAVMNSSVSDSSEEFYPLRKVNCTKTHPGCTVSRDISCSIKNSEASLLSSTSSSDGARHEMSPVVPGEECSKDRKAEVGDTGSYVNEVIEKTWEHLYAAAWPCTNENTTLKTEACSAVEKLEEKQMGKNVSLVTLLPSQDLNNKTISGKSPVSDPDVNDDIVALHTKYPSDGQVHCDLLVEKLNVEQKSISSSESSSGLGQSCFTICHDDDGTDICHNKRHDVNNDEQSIASKTTWTSISPISESSNSNNKQQKVLSEKLEPLLAFAKNRVEQTFNSSDSVMIKTQAEITDGDDNHLQCISICKRKRKNQPMQLAETILANADTSTPAKYYPKTLTKIMQEMGPPLPPLLPPLIATPPRTVQPISPVASISSQSSLPSPLDELISPLHKTPVPPLTSTLSETPKRKSSSSSSSSAFTTLSPSEMSVRQRILSSPLQFCSTTPKHALPVPGRLPSSTAGNSVPSVPQENSVKILDSMYPELSARARTLNILKGNIQFSRSSSLDGKGIQQISGFKAIASTSTAFVKTGIRFKSDPEKLLSSVYETGKRKLPSVTITKSVKRPRLDSKLSTLNLCKEKLSDGDIRCTPDGDCLDSGDATKSTGDCNSELLLEMEKTEDPDSWAVTVALEKISEACFDLLPVIRSRVLVGNTSKVPIMRDEEKEVVYELGVKKKSLAEPALQAILTKLKKQKMSLGHNYIQALCRVYVGICCQLGDLEKARLFCYTLLKEDFPRSDQLILFIANIWSEVFSSESVINKAIQLVARQRAKGDVLKCLKTYLSWEENAPVDISMMISSLLWAIQLCPQMEFQLSEKYGEDLKENTWQYVFAIDLLCSYQKWCWTHDNIISKELWPIMDNWIKNRNSNGSISSSSDIIIATVLRLIGRLGQIGLREGFFPAVENISSVIGVFLQHAKEKDVAWGVQLAAAYALFDLGPSNPSRILEAIHAWKAVNTISLPPTVLNGIAEVSSLLTCTGRTEDC